MLVSSCVKIKISVVKIKSNESHKWTNQTIRKEQK